jgi:hypothetical protein
MDTQIPPPSEAEGHRPPVAGHERFTRVPTPVGTSHESPVTSCKFFRFTHFRKNASATPLVSHTFKTTIQPGMVVLSEHREPKDPSESCNPFRLIHFRKNASATPFVSHTSKTKDLKPFRFTHFQKKGGWRGTRRRGSYFRLSTVTCQLSRVSPLDSALTSKRAAKSFTSNTYEKHTGGEGGSLSLLCLIHVLCLLCFIPVLLRCARFAPAIVQELS